MRKMQGHLTRHRSERRSRRTGRVRALLSVGMLLGVAQVSTLAAWTDSATVPSGTFATGTLDLRVGETTADQLGGQGGSWHHSSLTLSDLAPGESVAQWLTVGNGGSIPLTYTASVSTADDALSGPNGLRLSVVEGATDLTNTGSHAANDRTGRCEGGTPTALTDTPVGTSATPLHDSAVSLPSGTTTTYCVVASLADGAPNTMQGKSSTIVLSFEADQS